MSEIAISIADQPVATGRAVKIVTFVGSLDESNIDEKSQVLYDMITALPQGAAVIFDFAGLTYMNSKSIGYLTDWYLKIVDDKQGMALLTQVPVFISDVLDTVGLLQIFPHYPTLDEAVASVSV